ncbi:MAG TPA: 2,4'-dihydroxyacetophenone dioxygenase family protein [Polyangiaceae bacterium]|nr:2,4'-dihydroxyacetophenone dioxygenase family protein [Polyangiaceae bacterium]
MTTKNAPAANPPVDTSRLEWVPITEGLSFKPITYFPDDSGYQLLLRVEPGTVVPRHRHTGEVHAFTLSGARVLLDTDQIVGPGVYVYEPPGNVDSWKAVGDEPCVVHVEVNGGIEYLADDGTVARVADARSSRRAYLAWCAQAGRTPDPSLAPAPGRDVDARC